MSYSEFTLKRVKQKIDLKTVENQSLFSEVQGLQISDYLTQTLKRNLPLALAINTEKARSELIIINMLLEDQERASRKISLFSGIDFNVDKDQGLTGFCDYILGQSEEQLYLDAPVVAIAEAKNENIISALGQGIAEMYAAQIFNQAENHPMPWIYGAVTTGDEWKFLKLKNRAAYIDRDSYYMSKIDKILGILIAIVEQ
ncbi:MAG: hypothetical protein ACFCBU_04410 [Cyanophyceae cyanobacterium]